MHCHLLSFGPVLGSFRKLQVGLTSYGKHSRRPVLFCVRFDWPIPQSSPAKTILRSATAGTSKSIGI